MSDHGSEPAVAVRGSTKLYRIPRPILVGGIVMGNTYALTHTRVPKAPTYSSLYNDEASACTSGFSQIKSQVPNWSTVIASFSNGVCSLTKSGTYIGSLAIYSAYDYNIAPEASPPSFDYIDDSGHATRFSLVGGVITAPPGYGLKLTQTATGYTLTDGDDNVEIYDASGRLLSITSRAGVVQTMSYDASARLSVVADNFGHQLILNYDLQNRLTTVTRQ